MSRPVPRRTATGIRPTDLRLLIPAALAWVVVASSLATPPERLVWGAAGSALVALVAAGSAWWRRARSGRSRRAGTWGLGLSSCAFSAVTVSLALSSLAASSAVREAGPVRELAANRATVTVTGTVTADPRALDPPAGRPESASRAILRVAVDQVSGRGSAASVQSPVLLLGDRSWLAVRWQERVEVTGRLAPSSDPGDDVVAVLTATGGPVVLAEPGLVATAADTVRGRFAQATDGLPADARGLLPGLVIGDTSRTPADLDAAMLVTGMTHLSAVSGSNVAIVLTAALGIGRWVGLRRRWRPLVAGVLLLGFVVLVRPEPSVIRAATMGAVGLVGLGASRGRAGIPALAAAILLLLCWDPWLARSPGFALSVLATLGLLLFVGSWGAAISRRLPVRIRPWGPALAIPCAAQLMCAPVVVLLQSSVSVVGVVANLLAAPMVAPATVLGVATALTSVVSPTVASWLGWLACVPTQGIAWVAHTGAAVPFATVPWPGSGWGAVLLAVLAVGVVLAAPWLAHHARRRPLLPAAGMVVALGALVPTQMLVWPPPAWAFVACDVGQGDGLVLRTGPGRAVVVDTGPDPALIDGCLSRLGVGLVDAVVLTHFHADHVDGLPGVLRGRSVRQIVATPVRDPGYQWQEVADWAAAAGVPMSEVYAGDDLAWPPLTAHVWWPARVIHEGSIPNNGSVVMSVDVGGLRLLMLGDVEREAAHQVLAALAQGARGPPSFDVLKVAHHGSANRDDALLSTVNAPVAVISVGAGNDYGHPAASTLALLAHDGYRVLRTDLDGDIAIEKEADGRLGLSTAR